MFENLTERLSQTVRKLSGTSTLNEKNIKEALREVRMAMLEADVALPVVKDFLNRIKVRAVGQEVLRSLTPGQALIKVVNDELVTMMGSANETLNLQTQPPAIILLAGLQGAGKTTTIAKLSRWLIERQKKKVMVVSTDVYRPAAIDQLKVLAEEVGAHFCESDPSQKPLDIAEHSVQAAKKQMVDVLLVDTAGRLHIDDEMMAEVKSIHAGVNPIETLFIVDSMTGQDAANSAKAFHEALPLTGVILTKVDGDARGGAALSIRAITGKPIKFLGVGEKTTALEPFHPERIASRILGMGDVLSLIEEAEQKIDAKKAAKMAKKVQKGVRFNLEDFKDQLQQMKQMGGVGSLLDKLPGVGALPQAAKDKVDDKMFSQMEAIICSMTSQERKFPDIIKGSRKKRIAAGSGTQLQDVNRLLKQFSQMQKMMKKFSKKGAMAKAMRAFQGMGGPGMGGPGGNSPFGQF